MSTITARGDGKWLIAVDHGKDPASGKRIRRWRTFTGGKRQAQAEATRLEAEAKVGLAITADKMTVAEFLKRWLADVKARVSPKTYERYTEIVGNITLQLGQVRFDQLKPAQISLAWTRALESGRRDGKGGLSPRTVHHMHVVFKGACNGPSISSCWCAIRRPGSIRRRCRSCRSRPTRWAIPPS